ncbi:hypothetical protein HK102_013723 [Quaeritorhiza haematococci]|nr:hypothetical protein HK102_013723 [Quaeritorhiza haematococci]
MRGMVVVVNDVAVAAVDGAAGGSKVAVRFGKERGRDSGRKLGTDLIQDDDAEEVEMELKKAKGDGRDEFERALERSVVPNMWNPSKGNGDSTPAIADDVDVEVGESVGNGNDVDDKDVDVDIGVVANAAKKPNTASLRAGAKASTAAVTGDEATDEDVGGNGGGGGCD